jgi:glycosyltransferase involved in cell wall biosynthesis
MRVGIIAPPWLTVPPGAYGGTESVIDNLARGLHRSGHTVRLFTVGDSTCPVGRRFLYRRAAEPMGDSLAEAAHVAAAYEALDDVDIIHDHTVVGPLVARRFLTRRIPVVVTWHAPFDLAAKRLLTSVAGWCRIVAISQAHARSAGPVPVFAVVPHGVDLETYRPGPGGGGYLAFVGRMCADKGVHRVIRVAKAAGRPLRIVTKMHSEAEHDYFERAVRPLLDAGDEPPVELPLAERVELLRHADGLLDPIRWPEPFGLVMAEALAAGTPVLAFPFGAAPEIVDDGRTGYLCPSEAGMAAAVGRLADIDRAACRRAAEQRFSAERMAADYVRLYEQVTNGRPAPTRTGGELAGRPG